MARFDFIVIGGGSAGCIVAAELAADGRTTVLLLEAGEAAEHHPETLRADGYKDAAQLRKEPALDPLRARDDFKKLLAELEKAPSPPKPADQPKP